MRTLLEVVLVCGLLLSLSMHVVSSRQRNRTLKLLNEALTTTIEYEKQVHRLLKDLHERIEQHERRKEDART